jgi:phosphatidate cytidylyltransferase
LVGLPILLGLVIYGPAWSVILVLSLLAVLAWLEYGRIAGTLHPLFLASGLVCGLGFILLTWLGWHPWIIFIFTAGVTLYAGSAVALHARDQQVWAQVERSWLGLALVFMPLGAMSAMATEDLVGRFYLLFLLAAIFAGDTGAYFVGRALGKKKLCPTISPKKTWAGFWGGLLGGALVGLGGGILDGDPPDLLTGPALGLAVAGLGVIGDLMISMLKRHYKVKDAGSLLPGHGGVLDRLDSFILAGPWLFLVWRIWGDS